MTNAFSAGVLDKYVDNVISVRSDTRVCPFCDGRAFCLPVKSAVIQQDELLPNRCKCLNCDGLYDEFVDYHCRVCELQPVSCPALSNAIAVKVGDASETEAAYRHMLEVVDHFGILADRLSK